MQKELAELSLKMVSLNGFTNFNVENCKIQEIPAGYREKFSLILCNPPYERGGFENGDPQKAICRKEITVNLKEIAEAAAANLKYGGRVAITNRADRLAEVCYTFREVGIEIKRVQFVSGTQGAKPYLLLAEGVKGGRPTTEILPALVNGAEK